MTDATTASAVDTSTAAVVLDASSLCSDYDLPPAESPQQQQHQQAADNDTDISVSNNCNSSTDAATVAAAAVADSNPKRSVSETVRRKIRQLYRRSFGRADASTSSHRRHHDSGSGSGCGLSASAAAASAVAAAAAAAAAPSPDRLAEKRLTGSNFNSSNSELPVQQQQPSYRSNMHDQQQAASAEGDHRPAVQQANVSNRGMKAIQPIIHAASEGDKKDDDLYTVLTVDAEELKNFYSGIYVVAQCEGVRLKTKRTNKLDDIQTAFIFYRQNPGKNPIEFKMYANHLTLRRRVLIGQLSMTLKPGEPFDGMSVRRSIRERPELRTEGGSGLLFNFMSGMLHTQHLSGV